MDYRDFGYRRIRVLRPLRMALHIGEEGLAKLKAEKTWEKLSPSQKAAWTTEIGKHLDEVHEYGWAAQFTAEVAEKRPSLGKVSKSFLKAVVNSFGVRDRQGEIVMENGEPVADDELTDYENVPLCEDVNDYLAREVLPHVPDAYIDQTYRDEIDHQVGIVGFEINFNRYFYEFKPPRSLHEIDEDLKAVSRSIMSALEDLAE